ncbi:MAG: hypothetical protein M3512_04055 [Bacteroidota bacterium]|nr:hypothetical protein [Bacteroidota bacterium]
MVKNNKSGAILDLDEAYSIKAKEGDELLFSFIGMVPASALVGKANIITCENKQLRLQRKQFSHFF